MAGGLFALLDDVAALVKLAAASVDDVGAAAARASSKAAGVVIDDAAVTPQYVQGLAAERELPIVKQIALGSLRNKFLVILPLALLLSQFAPVLLTPILMVGGTFLAYEGAHKLWEKIQEKRGRVEGPTAAKALEPVTAEQERTLVSGAVRTDLILSAEIMVISLNEVADETFLRRLLILAVVALAMTIVVYGVVGLIVKMDDFGLFLSQKARSGFGRGFGTRLVKAMPGVLAFIGAVGTVAMLWVGGHILLVGVDELGWHWPYGVVHDIEHAVEHAAPFAAGALGWIANTACSAFVGLLVGAVVVAVLTALGVGHGGDDHASEHGDDDAKGSRAATSDDDPHREH